MTGRIQILVNATVRGENCHRQCSHFQDIGNDRYCCMAFNYNLLGRSINGNVLRVEKCIAAEKRAARLARAAK